MNEYIDLFFTFARIGGLTFGGGIAMLPMLEKEVVNNKKWTTSEELLDYFAIGQCTPGIIAVNVATFIGYKQKGISGGIVSTLGMIFPSVVIILSIAFFLEPYMNVPIVQSAFAGIRVGVAAIIANAVVGLFKKGVKDGFTFILFLLAFIAVAFIKLSPIYVVVVAIALGIVKAFQERGNK